MSITKETFMKQKLQNFIAFIERELGKDNNIYKELKSYETNFDNFLRILLHLQKFSKLIDDELGFAEEDIVKFLESRGVMKKALSEKPNCAEILKKINSYFSMFISVLNK